MKDNFFIILWTLLLITTGIMLYHTSGDVHHINKSIRHTEYKIAAERHSIAVLNAEFYALTSPNQLEKLATQHMLEFKPMTGTQLTTSVPKTTDAITIKDDK